jgi:hypothetical protein
MSTLRPFDSSSHRPRSRAITREWKSGEVSLKPGEFRPSETVLKFSVRHSKEGKVLYASLRPVEVSEGMETWGSDNPGIRILSEPIKRYSEKALAEFSARAYARLVEFADDPRVAQYLDQIPGVRQAEAVAV